jgi:hypothetical protein
MYFIFDFLVHVLNPPYSLSGLWIVRLSILGQLIGVTGIHEGVFLYFLDLLQNLDVSDHLLLRREAHRRHNVHYFRLILVRGEDFFKISSVHHVDQSFRGRRHNSNGVLFGRDHLLLSNQLKRFDFPYHEKDFLIDFGALPLLRLDRPKDFIRNINLLLNFQGPRYQEKQHLGLRVIFEEYLSFVHDSFLDHLAHDLELLLIPSPECHKVVLQDLLSILYDLAHLVAINVVKGFPG